MRVLVQHRFTAQMASAAVSGAPPPSEAEGLIPGLQLDAQFPAVQLPTPRAPEPGTNQFAYSQPIEFLHEPEQSTYLMRGEIPDNAARQVHASRHPDVVGVFADPVIESTITCGGDPAVGNAQDVAQALNVSQLSREGMDGQGVALAIVDTGIKHGLSAWPGPKPAAGREIQLDSCRGGHNPGTAS